MLRKASTVMAAAGFALLLADAIGWWPLLWAAVTGIDPALLPAHIDLIPWGWTMGVASFSFAIRVALERKRPAKTF